MHLLVTGASGLLGLNLSHFAIEAGHQVTGLVHSRSLLDPSFTQIRVDLSQADAIEPLIEAVKPDAIIHCAAVADLNLAEKYPELTYYLNATVPGSLAEETFKRHIPLIHISTDAVFDGGEGDYTETDPAHPLSVYAKSKLAGEQAVLENNPEAIIARVVFFGWSLSGKRSLSEFFFNHLNIGEPVKGFTDTFFSPLYTQDLSLVLLDMLAKGLRGLYHVVSPQSLSKYAFGRRIALQFGFDPQLVKPINASEVDRGAVRSLNLTLRPDKLESALGYSLPSVDDGIAHFYQHWQTGFNQRLQGLASV